MINNHIKSWIKHTIITDRVSTCYRGFFMASRRQTCQESIGKRTVTSTEKIKEMII